MVFSPCSCWRLERTFIWSLLWEPGQVPHGKSHNTVEYPLWLGLPGVFNSHICPHWVSLNSSTTVQVSFSDTGFWRGTSGFCWWVSALLWWSVPAYLSPQFGGGGRDLPCGLIFLIDLRRVVDFSTSYTVNMKQHLIYTCSLNFIGKLICWIAFRFQVVQW